MVTYNLWKSKGYLSFMFYNKTDKNLYINLIESNFVMNGESFDYYNMGSNSTISTTTTVASRYGAGSTTTTLSDSYKHRYPIICVPPKTMRYVQSMYVISEVVYRDCYLFYDPFYTAGNKIHVNGKRIELKGSNYEYFTKNNSPYVFKNIIAYSDSNDWKNLHRIENAFYVSKITNYKENEIVKSRYKDICDIPQSEAEEYFTIYSANKFYIPYIIGESNETAIRKRGGH